MSYPKLERKLLKELFSQLNNSNVSYCVLRNYDLLPYSLGESDLDLAVIPDDLLKTVKLVKEVTKRYGGEVIIDYVSSGRMMRFLGCHEGVWWGMAIDFFSRIEYKGVEYVSTKKLVDRSKTHNDIVRVADDCDANMTALVKELLSNGCLRKKYYENAVASYLSDARRSIELLREFITPKTVDKLECFLKNNSKNKSDVIQIVSQLRKDILLNHWMRQLPLRLKNIFLRHRRVFRPVGTTIAILGTDGSGKTTMINAVTPVLAQALHSKIQYEHLRPNWLPALGVASGKRLARGGAPVTDPHAQNPSGFFGSLVRLTYYSIDYILGYWFHIFPRLVKRPHICLFDRYYYDLIIDQRRMRISLPRWIRNVFFVFAPQPRLIFCLGSDPEKIYARKPETSLEEVRRQTHELAQICENNRRAVWIDTGQGIESSKHQILESIQQSLSSR